MYRLFNEYKDIRIWKLVLIIVLLSFSSVFSYYCNEGMVPFIILRICMSSTFLLFLYSSFKFTYNTIRPYFLIVFFIMIIMSIVNVTPTAPILTLVAIGSMMVSGVLSRKLDIVIVHKALVISVIIFSFFIIFQLLKLDLDMDVLLRRGYVWTEIFAYAGLVHIWPILVIMSFLMSKSLVVSIGYWILAIILNMLFLKRAILVDSLIVLLILLFISLKLGRKHTFNNLIKVIVVFIVVFIVVSNINGLSTNVELISNVLNERFESTTEDLSSFDRFIESRDYLMNEASFIDIVFGKGFLGAHHSLASEHYYLHIGWLNWLFKGGILLLLGIITIYFKVFNICAHLRAYPIDIQFSAIYCVYIFFTLFYINMMGFSFSLFLYFYSLMMISSCKKYEDCYSIRVKY